MLTRRDALRLGATSCLTGSLVACVGQLSSCPIGWVPTMLAPVFYGYRDYVACRMVNAPPSPASVGGGNVLGCPSFSNAPSDLKVRIFFPTLDGSPQNAVILGPCRRFPLVLLVHGDCGGDPFQQWFSLPAEIARCGYVVAVTGYGGFLATGDPSETLALHRVYSWLLNDWEHRDSLMPPPATAIIGHSYGGTLAAQFIPEIPAQAFVSLSGTFGQSPNFSTLLSNINVPRLCCWNDNDDAGVNAVLFSNGSQQLWSLLQQPKHAIIFKQGQHADYFPNTAPTCGQGPCASSVRLLAADFVSAFLSKYMPPEFGTASTYVPESLFVSPASLPQRTLQQEFYAGSFLSGFALSQIVSAGSSKPCGETSVWVTTSGTGQLVLG